MPPPGFRPHQVNTGIASVRAHQGLGLVGGTGGHPAISLAITGTAAAIKGAVWLSQSKERAADKKIRTRIRDEADGVAVARSIARLQRLRADYAASVEADGHRRLRSSRRRAHHRSVLELTDYGLRALEEREARTKTQGELFE